MDDTNIDDISVDDALEETRTSKLISEVGKDALPEDYDSPAAPASNPYVPSIPLDHPSLDAELDSTEVYNDDVNGAASSSGGTGSANDQDIINSEGL